MRRAVPFILAIGFLIAPIRESQASDSTAAPRAELLSAETRAKTVEDGGTGPYPAVMASDSTLPTHTIFRPADMSVFGAKNRLPVFAWGNGACANSPWEHLNFLSEVASHGFLVIAIGPMPGEGERGRGRSQSSQLIDAINWAIVQNGLKTGPYGDKIDVEKIAVGGMSCGGLQAYEAAPHPAVKTVMICNSGIFIPDTASSGRRAGMPGMPALTKDQLEKVHSPVLFILGGESDIAYKNGMDDFDRVSHVPVFAANLDVGHGGTYGQPHGGDFAVVAAAWLKWRLKGDPEAAKMFTGDSCGVSRMPGWRIAKKNIP